MTATGTCTFAAAEQAVTGLDYFGARYFSAAQGRFTSPDELKGGIVDPFTGQRSQFEERAAPTDQLIALARGVSSPIYVQCFPLPPLVAEEAVRLAMGRAPETLLWNPTEADRHPGAIGFCYRPKLYR